MQGIPSKLSSPIIHTPNKGLYQIQKQLGQGAYGEVFLVMNLQTKIKYALKKQQDMSKAEQDIMNQLANKQFSNLINVIEYYQSPSDKHFYIVMEYCESDLYQEMQKKVFQEDGIRYIMKQIATGIHQLHSLNIIHRDIKPENILIYNLKNDQGRTQQIYKICDFGLSKQANITQTAKQGTPYYLSPEQLKPGNQYTNSVDIWAFGAVIYELLKKKPLFDGQTQEEVYQKIKNQDINELLSTILKSQLEYQALLMRMLDRDPLKRPNIEQVILKLSPSIISGGLSPPIRTPTLQPPSYQPSLKSQSNYYNQRVNNQPMKLEQKQESQVISKVEVSIKQQSHQVPSSQPVNNKSVCNYQNYKSHIQAAQLNNEQGRSFIINQPIQPQQPIQLHGLTNCESRGRQFQPNNPIKPNNISGASQNQMNTIQSNSGQNNSDKKVKQQPDGANGTANIQLQFANLNINNKEILPHPDSFKNQIQPPLVNQHNQPGMGLGRGGKPIHLENYLRNKTPQILKPVKVVDLRSTLVTGSGAKGQ